MLKFCLRAKSPPHRCRDGPAPLTTVGGGELHGTHPHWYVALRSAEELIPAPLIFPANYRFRLEPEAADGSK